MPGVRPRHLGAPRWQLLDRDRGIQFDVFAPRELTPEELKAAIKEWLGERTINDLQPWRTYRIQMDKEEEA